jgi:hypothetical protein
LTPPTETIRVQFRLKGEGVTMPKKYRVELSIVDDESDTQLDSDSHTETYADDTQAREKFKDKLKAARETGRGPR